MSDYFVNDKYRVLQCMSTRQIKVNDALIIKLSQQEIADILGFTKPKVNGIIHDLKQNGYLTQLGSRGKYSLTEAANKELSIIQSEEEIK